MSEPINEHSSVSASPVSTPQDFTPQDFTPQDLSASAQHGEASDPVSNAVTSSADSVPATADSVSATEPEMTSGPSATEDSSEGGTTGETGAAEKKDRPRDAWEPVRARMRSKGTVQARVVKWQRNGLEMEIEGEIVEGHASLRAFMPNDQIDRDPNRNVANYFGKTLPVKITNIKAAPSGAAVPEITVSHRAVLEEEIRLAGKEAIKQYNVGDVIDAKVKSFSHDNVNLDLGLGIDAVIRMQDLSWKPVSHPYEILKRGETVQAKILSLDRGRRQMRLGIKQLTTDPELERYSEYASGQTHTAKVVSINNFGAEVELPNGLIAFLPLSEISWQRIGSVADALTIADEFEVKVLTVTPENKRITVSRKQLVEDPLRAIENTFRVGTDHAGTIKEVTRGGLVVTLEHGAEAFIPRRELSHDRIERLEDVFKAGKPLEGLRVIEYDRGHRGESRTQPRITMSLIAAEREAQRTTLRDYRATSKASRYSLSDSLAALRDKLAKQEQEAE